MTRYYDYVLGLIPVVLFGLTAILLFAGIQLTLAVPVGAGAAVLVIGHALFVNVPGQVEPMAEQRSTVHPNTD
ncbi:hypothetical protein [Halohasta litorea]|uniref:Uncharacterized protein n=1 Tax=Halohasta litorea TaxID=869891 RepID=A0ABD6DAL8_9EURY|nr:hypothetical protein [Halohasta litorea]MEA1931670.1 hypothetical protein [Euryarchaeota archaeon]